MYNQNNNHHLNNQPISNGKITNHNHASQPTNGSPINIHQLFPTRTEKECLAEASAKLLCLSEHDTGMEEPFSGIYGG